MLPTRPPPPASSAPQLGTQLGAVPLRRKAWVVVQLAPSVLWQRAQRGQVHVGGAHGKDVQADLVPARSTAHTGAPRESAHTCSSTFDGFVAAAAAAAGAPGRLCREALVKGVVGGALRVLAVGAVERGVVARLDAANAHRGRGGLRDGGAGRGSTEGEAWVVHGQPWATARRQGLPPRHTHTPGTAAACRQCGSSPGTRPAAPGPSRSPRTWCAQRTGAASPAAGPPPVQQAMGCGQRGAGGGHECAGAHSLISACPYDPPGSQPARTHTQPSPPRGSLAG